MVRSLKNLLSGLLFLAFAAAGLYFGSSLTLGTARNMGPAYFPMIVSTILAVIGTSLVLIAFVVDDEGVNRPRIRALVPVAASVVLFAVAIRPLGLVISVFLMTIVASFGDRESSLLERLALALGLATAATLLFVYGIGLPIEVFPA